MPTIYFAGPEVLLPDAEAVGRRKKALCEAHGFTGLFPLDEPQPTAGAGRVRPDLGIYRANVSLMRRADFGVCNLTPFRGPSADPGTVFELGLLIGLGKRVFGYTNVAADLLTRVRAAEALTFDAASGLWRDGEGMFVEDFGNADNLMIDAALLETGNPLIRREAAARFRDLSGFEACLRLAASRD